MTQQLLATNERDRPALIMPIALLAAVYAIVLFVCGALSFASLMPMRYGASLIGSGLEVMGPVPYFLFAIALAFSAWGLPRANTWARRLLIIVCGAGIVFLVPHISSAVVDERYFDMSLDGTQILIRVAIASYLFRESEWFERKLNS